MPRGDTGKSKQTGKPGETTLPAASPTASPQNGCGGCAACTPCAPKPQQAQQPQVSSGCPSCPQKAKGCGKGRGPVVRKSAESVERKSRVALAWRVQFGLRRMGTMAQNSTIQSRVLMVGPAWSGRTGSLLAVALGGSALGTPFRTASDKKPSIQTRRLRCYNKKAEADMLAEWMVACLDLSDSPGGYGQNLLGSEDITHAELHGALHEVPLCIASEEGLKRFSLGIDRPLSPERAMSCWK